MHWDFFTVLSVLSGIVLIASSLCGPAVGTGGERLGIFVMGAFSFAYGIWVATQVSGFYLFSVAPAALAIGIVIRAAQRAGRKMPPATQPNPGPAAMPAGAAPAVPGAQAAPYPPAPAPSRTSALRAAQPGRIREAVNSRSTTFCPAFLLPGSAEPSIQGSQHYHSASLAIAWSTADSMPRMPDGEELLGIWHAGVRVKVAVGTDLHPAPATHGVSWVTVVDGTGVIALTMLRVVGVAVRGDSLLGTFGPDGTTGIALWSLPLRHISSVADAPGGGLLLSSADPAGHVTLTRISTGEVADMINRTRGSRSPASNAGKYQQPYPKPLGQTQH